MNWTNFHTIGKALLHCVPFWWFCVAVVIACVAVVIACVAATKDPKWKEVK